MADFLKTFSFDYFFNSVLNSNSYDFYSSTFPDGQT